MNIKQQPPMHLLKRGNLQEHLVDFSRIIGKPEVKAIGDLGTKPGNRAPLRCETIAKDTIGYIQDQFKHPTQESVYWPWTQSRIQQAFHPKDCLIPTGKLGTRNSGPPIIVRKVHV